MVQIHFTKREGSSERLGAPDTVSPEAVFTDTLRYGDE
jgi:hypothetical protein